MGGTAMKNPAAVALGKMKSAAKSKAARENGKLGGRPRKPKRVARRANARADLPRIEDANRESGCGGQQ